MLLRASTGGGFFNTLPLLYGLIFFSNKSTTIRLYLLSTLLG